MNHSVTLDKQDKMQNQRKETTEEMILQWIN